MRVAVLMGSFSAESRHLAAVGQAHDIVVYGSTQRLRAHNYQPEAPDGCQTRDFDPVLLGRNGHLRWVYRGLDSALYADQPDLLHVISEPWGTLALQAAQWARRHDFGGLVIHGCDQHWRSSRGKLDLRRWPRLAAARFGLKAAGGFAGENSGAIEQAREGGLSENVPTAVIRTSPRDPNLFTPPTESERRRARQSLGLPTEGVGIGLLGRLVPEKGSTVFLEAWSMAEDRLDSTRAWAAIAGSGPLESDLRDKANHNTTLVGALEYPDDVVRYFQAIDVFVHPPWRTDYWAEQGPRVVVEAMLSGCLIVATESGAIPEMIGDTGVLVPERDSARLADAIVDAVNSIDERPLAPRGRERALNEFSVGATAKKLEHLWSRVLERT